MSKALLVNTIAIGLIVLSFLSASEYTNMLLFAGLFALSGAVTNQLAIYMLFERVPFLYGSGVIEKNFEAFKAAIKTMMMQEFFSQERLQDFFVSKASDISLQPLVEAADFSVAFDALSKTVMESKFGSAISMFGGEDALEGLREPFSLKLQKAVSTIVGSSTFQTQLAHQLKEFTGNTEMRIAIESLIEERLKALSPTMVKALIQSLIREHLQWLVVWGGLFGGLLGILSSFLV